MKPLFGGIEGGGTKFVCAVGSGAAILSEDHDGVIYSTSVILVSLRQKT
jgi:hypothetical protein